MFFFFEGKIKNGKLSHILIELFFNFRITCVIERIYFFVMNSVDYQKETGPPVNDDLQAYTTMDPPTKCWLNNLDRI